jgi:hypothetical protein
MRTELAVRQVHTWQASLETLLTCTLARPGFPPVIPPNSTLQFDVELFDAR